MASEDNETSRLRIMHCLRAPMGGLFRHVRDLVTGQNEQGHLAGIVCDSSDDGSASAELEDLEPVCELGIHRLAIARRVSPRDFLTYRQIKAVCARKAPDILHGHGAKGGAYARILAQSLGAAAVYTPHGGSLHYSPNTVDGRFYLSIERLLRTRTAGLIFESDYARRSYISKIGEPQALTELIVNGLYDHEFIDLTDAPAEYDFVFVGELRALKGPQVLVEAIQQIDRRCRTLLVGAGPMRAQLQSDIRARRLESRIELQPPIHQAADAFARGACVIVPSLAESLPYIVLEAAAAGRPLIATNVGGIPEIFGSAADRLIAAGDSAALANAMSDFLDHRDLANAQARYLRESVRERFQVRQMVASTSGLYHAVADSRPSRRDHRNSP